MGSPLTAVRAVWAARCGQEPDRSGPRSEREVRSGNNCADSFLEGLAVTGRRETGAARGGRGVQGRLSFCQWNVCMPLKGLIKRDRTLVDAQKARAVLDDLIDANQRYWPELK